MKMSSEKIFKELFAGGISGCCAKTVVSPLDRTKILLQAQHPYYRSFGVFTSIPEIIKREGFLSLWKGNLLMMVRIFPYSAVQFFSYKRYDQFYSSIIGEGHLHRAVAGSSAGVTSVFMTYPLDVMRTKITFQITGEHQYHSIVHAFKTVYKTEGGVQGFFRGISATFLGMILYAGASFYTFNTLKENLIAHAPETFARPDINAPNVYVLQYWASLGSGAFAGAISQTVSFPLDVARRRMQLANMLPDTVNYKTVWSTLLTVYRQNGVIRGLYRGLTINYVRVIPQQAVAFTVHEIMLEILGLNKRST